jgi:hypothetical protein
VGKSKTTVEQTISKSKSKAKIGGASKKGRQHVAHQKKYSRQFDRTAKNKAKAWASHLAVHPNDLVAKERIKAIRGAF